MPPIWPRPAPPPPLSAARCTVEGRLLRSYREGPGATGGFADDYAAITGGLLDLYEASGEIEWLQWAVELRDEAGRVVPGSGKRRLFLRAGRRSSSARAAEGRPRRRRALAKFHGRAKRPAPRPHARRRRPCRSLRQNRRALSRKCCAATPTSMPALLGVLQLSLIHAAADRARRFSRRSDALFAEARAHTGLETALLYADGAAGQAWLAGRLPFMETMAPSSGREARCLSLRKLYLPAADSSPAEVRAALG